MTLSVYHLLSASFRQAIRVEAHQADCSRYDKGKAAGLSVVDSKATISLKVYERA